LDGADSTSHNGNMLMMRVAHRVRREIRAMQQRLFDDLNEFEKTAERRAPGSILAEPKSDTNKAKPKKPTKEPLAEIIKLPTPANQAHALCAVPLTRHWLFAPDRTKLRVRRFEVEVMHQRRHLKQSITIGDTLAAPDMGYGVLKVRHQRMLFALQQVWQDQGGRMIRWDDRRQGMVSVSSWVLEELMYGSHGGQQKRLVRRSIQELASIPVMVSNFIGPDGDVHNLDVTGLIGGVEFASSHRGNGQQLGFPWVEIPLGSLITSAFEASAVKPLNMEVLRSLKRDTSALLYPKLDHHLATNEGVELRLDGLVNKLGMADKQLGQRSYRRRAFTSAVDELQGQPLSREGYVLDVHLEPTADKRDHKMIAERRRVPGKRRKLAKPPKPSTA